MNGADAGDASKGGTTHQTDWRLPNVKELQSLIDFGYNGPALCNTGNSGKWTSGDPFTGVQLYSYWSSTTRSGNTVNAWNVNMDGGGVNNIAKSTLVNVHVWPVRGGQ